MSSQRHRQVVMNYGAACTAIAEKQPAAGYLRQVPGPFTVPVGPTKGPLQGSSLAGPPPAAIPNPQFDFEHPLMAMGLLLAAGQAPVEPPQSEPSAVMPDRTFPDGPYSITGWTYEDARQGYVIGFDGDVRDGDTVRIEASGSSEINGDYILTVASPGVGFIEAPMAAKAPANGRLTVTGGA